MCLRQWIFEILAFFYLAYSYKPAYIPINSSLLKESPTGVLTELILLSGMSVLISAICGLLAPSTLLRFHRALITLNELGKNSDDWQIHKPPVREQQS